MLPSGTVAERALAARGLALLFGAGGVLVLVTLLLPHDGDTRALPLAAAATTALVTAALLVATARRTRPGVLEAVLAGGTVLITVCVVWGGAGATAYPLMYVWVCLYAGAFFSGRGLVIQVLVCAVAYVVALNLGADEPDPGTHWLMAMGTAVIAAVLLFGVMRRIREQADDLAAVAAVAGAASDDPTGAVCEALLDAAGASVVALLEPEGDGLAVRALAGGREAGSVLAGEHALEAMHRAYRDGELVDIEAEGSHRIGGFAQPVCRDGQTVAVLALGFAVGRRGLPERAETAAVLFATEACQALERADRDAHERRRRVLDINDNIVQGLVLASYALQQGRTEQAQRALDGTLTGARDLMSRQIGEVADRRPLRPGDLIRFEASTPLAVVPRE